MRYYDVDGKLQEVTLRGWVARIFQHEYDHLQVRPRPAALRRARAAPLIPSAEGRQRGGLGAKAKASLAPRAAAPRLAVARSVFP